MDGTLDDAASAVHLRGCSLSTIVMKMQARMFRVTTFFWLCCLASTGTEAQAGRALLPIELERSAEFAWLRKSVHASRILDDMGDSSRWRDSGTAAVTFPVEPRRDNMRV